MTRSHGRCVFQVSEESPSCPPFSLAVDRGTSASLAAFTVSRYLYASHSNWAEVKPRCDFYLHFLMVSDPERFFVSFGHLEALYSHLT